MGHLPQFERAPVAYVNRVSPMLGLYCNSTNAQVLRLAPWCERKRLQIWRCLRSADSSRGLPFHQLCCFNMKSCCRCSSPWMKGEERPRSRPELSGPWAGRVDQPPGALDLNPSSGNPCPDPHAMGLPRCVWARQSTAPAQGNQSLSRELRASALCPDRGSS